MQLIHQFWFFRNWITCRPGADQVSKYGHYDHIAFNESSWACDDSRNHLNYESDYFSVRIGGCLNEPAKLCGINSEEHEYAIKEMLTRQRCATLEVKWWAAEAA